MLETLGILGWGLKPSGELDFAKICQNCLAEWTKKSLVIELLHLDRFLILSVRPHVLFVLNSEKLTGAL